MDLKTNIIKRCLEMNIYKKYIINVDEQID